MDGLPTTDFEDTGSFAAAAVELGEPVLTVSVDFGTFPPTVLLEAPENTELGGGTEGVFRAVELTEVVPSLSEDFVLVPGFVSVDPADGRGVVLLDREVFFDDARSRFGASLFCTGVFEACFESAGFFPKPKKPKMRSSRDTGSSDTCGFVSTLDDTADFAKALASASFFAPKADPERPTVGFGTEAVDVLILTPAFEAALPTVDFDPDCHNYELS